MSNLLLENAVTQIPLAQAIEQLNFPVFSVPSGFNTIGTKEGSWTLSTRYNSIIRADEKKEWVELGKVSKHYQLVRHGDAMSTALQGFVQEHWRIAKVQLDNKGAKAHVMAILPSKEFFIEQNQVKNIIWPRILMSNAYDGTAALRLTTGLFWGDKQIPMIHPQWNATMRICHYGDTKQDLIAFGKMYEKIKAMLPEFKKATTQFQRWTRVNVGKEEVGKILLKLAGKRKYETAASYIKGTPSAWSLYVAGTTFLAKEFTGRVTESEKRNKELFDGIYKAIAAELQDVGV